MVGTSSADKTVGKLEKLVDMSDSPRLPVDDSGNIKGKRPLGEENFL